MAGEIETKQRRLAEFLERSNLDGVLLSNRNNFAWITGGKDNHIPNNTPVGVATILATRDSRVCLANTIEAPRFRNEELVGTGIDVVEFPWWDPGATRRVVGEVVGGKKVATDSVDFGLDLLKLRPDFDELRWSLTPEEIERYREGGHRASRAMETTCRQLRHAVSEHEVAGLLDHEVRNAGLNPTVTLVAADERIRMFRHPIPTDYKAREYVMLVSCAEYRGLISCLTRFVSFVPLSEEKKALQRAIANIDAATNLATRPGRTLGEIFRDIQRAYAENSHPDQWKLHHQGGSTGYSNRDVVANPESAVAVRENQAFAWNPSIVGTKSEDTVLCTAEGIEALTAASDDWPKIVGHSSAGELPRANMLVTG